MIVNVLNKAHFPIRIGEYIFPPMKEINIKVGSADYIFKYIRNHKSLRVGKFNNEDYIKRHEFKEGKTFNFIYDAMSQHAGVAYVYAIKALADPIIKFLPKKETIYNNIPVPGPKQKGLNCRFFNSARIAEQGKCPVGPNDIFISHGIGDKNYWVGE